MVLEFLFGCYHIPTPTSHSEREELCEGGTVGYGGVPTYVRGERKGYVKGVL